MATLDIKAMRCVGTISGNQPQMRVYTIAAAQVFDRGDVLIATAGEAVLAASPVLANDTVIGLAAHDADVAQEWYLGRTSSIQEGASGGTYGGTFMGSADLLGSKEGTGIHVFLANDDNIFEASAVDALALADLHDSVQLETSGGDVWVINQNGATLSAIVVAIPNYPDQAIGDINARLWFQFLASASILF